LRALPGGRLDAQNRQLLLSEALAFTFSSLDLDSGDEVLIDKVRCWVNNQII